LKILITQKCQIQDDDDLLSLEIQAALRRITCLLQEFHWRQRQRQRKRFPRKRKNHVRDIDDIIIGTITKTKKMFGEISLTLFFMEKLFV
jgi:hypothetical protein